MSKIICEICGTAYPDTANQCPICGCVRPADAQGFSAADSADSEKAYTYVKGGRFSKKNVKKRNKGKQSAGTRSAQTVSSDDVTDKKAGKGLVITAVILLLAIIAIVAYLAIRYFMPFFGVDLPSNDPVETPAESQYDTTPVIIWCDGVELDVYSITFDTAGESRLLYATLTPADTTEELVFTSDNEAVATVNADGKITAVAPGKATISAVCGDYSATCTVECSFTDATDETTESTEETTEPSVAPDAEFKLNRKDITFSRKDDTWVVYDGNVDLDKITWSSDNEKVATIVKGKVTAVGSGMTEVHAEYEGQKVSCIIRCNFSDSSAVTGSGGGVSEDGGNASTGGTTGSADAAYKLHNPYGNASDVTINVGYVFSLQLVDASGNAVSGATWSVSNQNCCSVANGTVTGVAAGTATVTASYNGSTYSCVVRVTG